MSGDSCLATYAVPSGGGTRVYPCALAAGHYDGPDPGDPPPYPGAGESWHVDPEGRLNWPDVAAGAVPHRDLEESAW